MTTHQTHEARLITALLALVCGLGCTAAIAPAAGHAITVGAPVCVKFVARQ